MTTLNDYWDDYYRRQATPVIPSQFAVFTACEFPNINTVIDIGCGNGRDSFFFAAHKKSVIGLDASAEAIRTCQQMNRVTTVDKLKFIRADIRGLTETVFPLVESDSAPILLYSRFLIHAVSAAQQEQLLASAATLLHRFSGVFAVEFRTKRDIHLKKHTAEHYRRYVDPHEFREQCVANDLAVSYFVEGTGFAKFKGDDAHVARFILSSTRGSYVDD